MGALIINKNSKAPTMTAAAAAVRETSNAALDK